MGVTMDEEASFSNRHGFVPDNEPIKIYHEAPDWLREYVCTVTEQLPIEPYFLRNQICTLLIETPSRENFGRLEIFREIRSLLYHAEWYFIYDVIEILARNLKSQGNLDEFNALLIQINGAFKRKGVGWQLLNNGCIQVRGEEIFEKSVQTAITAAEETGRTATARELHDALLDLSKRPAPDITGAIRHAIAALECVARDVTGDSRKTLGEIIKLHPNLLPLTLDKGVEKIWGYVSDKVRHIREREGHVPDLCEAELIVGMAGSIATYLIKKPKPLDSSANPA